VLNCSSVVFRLDRTSCYQHSCFVFAMAELLRRHVSSHCSYRVGWSTCPRIPICWVSSPPASVGMSPSCILWVRCPMVIYLSQQRYKYIIFYVSSVTVQWDRVPWHCAILFSPIY